MNNDLENLNVSIEEAEKYVSRMNNVLNLTKNKDFIELIEKGYFEREASRLVLLKADPNMQKEEDQVAIIKSIDAIGYLRQYLRNTIAIGRMMEKSLVEDQKTKVELMLEENE
jgi:hypothetical protein